MDVISVHVPKTAGTSFRLVLQDIYGEVRQDYPDRHDNPLIEYNDLNKSRDGIDDVIGDTKVIHGHFHVNKYDGLYPEAKRIIWIRNPISRIVSHYYYLKTVKQNPKFKTDGYRAMIHERKLSLLQFARLPHISNHLHKHYAPENSLDKFFFIGLTEYFEEDLKDLCKMMGWPVVMPPHANKSPAYTKSIDINTMEALHLLNLEDITIYRKAVKLRTLRREGLRQ